MGVQKQHEGCIMRSAIRIVENWIQAAAQTLSTQNPPPEAALYILATLACKMEAAKSLAKLIHPAQGSNDSILCHLSRLQVSKTLREVADRLSEYESDYGVKINPS